MNPANTNTAKKIEAGVYDYRGYRVRHWLNGDCEFKGEWVICEETSNGWDGVDIWDSLSTCKRMIDHWHNT